jgi:hypothetical protein
LIRVEAPFAWRLGERGPLPDRFSAVDAMQSEDVYPTATVSLYNFVRMAFAN